MALASSLSTDADTATERAAWVLVVPMIVLAFTLDAERSTADASAPKVDFSDPGAPPVISPHRRPVVASKRTISGCFDWLGQRRHLGTGQIVARLG